MPHIHLGGSARTIACLLVVTSCTRAVIAAQNSATSEQLTADTPKQTTAGATFIAPAGWTFSVRGPATIGISFSFIVTMILAQPLPIGRSGADPTQDRWLA